MSENKFLIKIAVTPYIILGLLTLSNSLNKWRAVNIDAMMNVSLYYASFIFLLFTYIVSGMLIASLYKDCKKISSNKILRIILTCNLIILLGLFGAGYLGIIFFVNIKDFLTFDFVLIGSYLYLLIQNLRFKNSGGRNESL
ncbi:hypothetical protein [Eubacterium callanderi]|uniref:Uncharacterized protein n=1 Tax=Eubacterium callanderi TaxID=53442 RepID=A0A853JM35_9FIRM|nr:hypothetical protein [Eubacterium callanderi]GFZ23777.1 hypothetical protein CMETHOX_17000 [[Clostridium] methoxybenzovorans]